MRLAIFMFVVFCQSRWVELNRMRMSPSTVINARVGETVELACNFSTAHFNLFDNPLLWEKQQYSDAGVHINMMGKILDPFASTRRYSARFTQQPPNYWVPLTIRDVQFEDSGNYTCTVNGPNNDKRGVTQHQLTVTAAIDSLFITTSEFPNATDFTNSDNTNDSTDHQRHHQSALVFTENDDRPLRCVAQGGYPPPDVTVQLGKENVTDYFQLTRLTRETGVPGLQSRYYFTERALRPTSDFRITPEDDGKLFRCIASAPDSTNNFSTARIFVHYAPSVKCYPKTASVNEMSVFVRCVVRGKPTPSIEWIVDDRGTAISDGQGLRDVYCLSQELHKKGGVETQLVIRKVTADKFRDYELIAENRIGTTRVKVELKQKEVSPARTAVPPRPYNSRQAISDHRLDYSYSIGVATVEHARRSIAMTLALALLAVYEISAVT